MGPPRGEVTRQEEAYALRVLGWNELRGVEMGDRERVWSGGCDETARANEVKTSGRRGHGRKESAA